MKKRSALISGALVTGGMVAGSIFAPLGLASAQTDDEPTTPESTEEAPKSDRGQKGEALAEFLGLTVDDLKAARESDQTLAQVAADAGVAEADLVAFIVEQRTERIEAGVESGRISEDDATDKLDGLEEQVGEAVNTPPSEQEGRGGGHHRRGARLGAIEVLEGLGVSADDIQAGREAGQTIAEIAADAGVSEADLVDALVAEATEQVEAKVEEGRIDAERADEITSNLGEQITERVNQDPSERPERGERGNRGNRGGDAPADDAPDA